MTRTFLILAQTAVALTWTPSTTPNATTTVYRDGQSIVSGLTAASYSDSTVTVGQHTYYVTADAPGRTTSPPSDPFQITIPPATQIPTVIGTSTSNAGSGYTRITVHVQNLTSAAIPQGTVTWTSGGAVFFTNTLDKQGKAVQNWWTVGLSNLPVTVLYSGNTTFAASSVTIR
jgi:hypothetical protein